MKNETGNIKNGQKGLKQRDPARWHTIYSIISTIVEEAGLAVLVLWILPLWGIVWPLWVLFVALGLFAIYSYIMYRIGHPTITYKKVNAPESIIGRTGTVERALSPEGFIRVNGELWKAHADGGNIEKGREVTVTGIDGLKLTVKAKTTR